MKIVKNLAATLFFLVVYSLGSDVVGQQTQGEPSLFNPYERSLGSVSTLSSQAVVPPTKQEYTPVGNTDRFHRSNRSDRISSRTTNLVPFQNLP
ncbi:MAG: hypothetical protein HOA14_10310, partial [Planctomycetaceae bacterium]|nr:hypothetical protein [Planctomycetaceae bacterium]